MKIFIVIPVLFFSLVLNASDPFNIKNDVTFDYQAYKQGKNYGRYLRGALLTGIDLNFLNSDNLFIDAEISTDLGFTYSAIAGKSINSSKAKLYRYWVRLGGNKFDLRAGLQKLNFGPARLLRSLQWFDRLDPRDPRQMTPGVESLLFRRYFSSSGMVWLWLIRGDGKTRGMDQYSSAENKIETGGRLELPFKFCETGFTFHFRELTEELFHTENPLEYRAGIDLRWDFEIGLWLEFVLNKIEKSDFLPGWKKMITLGGDYTFGIGNGIHCLVEHMFYSVSESSITANDETSDLSAFSLSYHFGFFSSLQAIANYDWDNRNVIIFLSYHLDFDYWGFYLNGSWTDEDNSIDFLPGNRYLGIILETNF